MNCGVCSSGSLEKMAHIFVTSSHLRMYSDLYSL